MPYIFVANGEWKWYSQIDKRYCKRYQVSYNIVLVHSSLVVVILKWFKKMT